MRVFEWDPAKAVGNVRKHGISFDDATLAFSDPYALFYPDWTQGAEERWHLIGVTKGQVVLLVVHAVRDQDENEVVRLISARRATRSERSRYGKPSS